MLFVVSAVLFDMLKARQLACVSKSGQKCPAALSLSSWRAWIEIFCTVSYDGCCGSLSSWRAWIEISCVSRASTPSSRSPHGERGLKLRQGSSADVGYQGRSPHGERGLKFTQKIRYVEKAGGRSPHGERGLKYSLVCKDCPYAESLSSWRAWIEIDIRRGIAIIDMSLSSWRAWIEMVC